jgi:hypothetical protein
MTKEAPAKTGSSNGRHASRLQHLATRGTRHIGDDRLPPTP